MDSQPLVSICIPTYNRSEYLRLSLERYIREPEFLSGCVEIVISDNTSTDDTGVMVQGYINKYANIRYFRNSENIRDRNFPLALSRGRGKLHRLCNDTLQIQQGHLGELCRAVEKYQHEKPFLFFENEGMGQQEIACSSLDEYVKNISFFISWIGGFSLWHEDCIGLESDTADCGLSLWQVRKSCEMAGSRRSIIIRKLFCTVSQIKSKDVSYGIFKVFHGNMLAILRRYGGGGGIAEETLAWVEKDLLYRFFTQYLVLAECQADKNLVYGEQENLHMAIQRCYGAKDYYEDYLAFYKKELRKCKIEMLVKDIFHWEQNKNSKLFQWSKMMFRKLLAKN